MAKKDPNERAPAPVVFAGLVAAVVLIALVVTLSWYFLHYGKTPWH